MTVGWVDPEDLWMICPSCAHRNNARANFCEECGFALADARAAAARGDAPRSYTPRHLADRILGSRSALEGERKQVTVLFADVKSSLALAEDTGLEDWHAILDRFFAILGDGVHRFEGTINQYTGDGIMALFGAPIAHEDHARRACYAALHLRGELRRYAEELRRTRGLNFSVRMGLNSGEVVVGRIGDDLRMDYTAQGHTVGLAQRMEQLAAPGNAYLTEHTASLVTGFFELRDLGKFEVRGVGRPVRVYELEDVGRLKTRFDLARTRGLSLFVGRNEQMAVLEEALELALAGQAQIVSVIGDAGVGKSRLCFEFLEICRSRGIRVAEGYAVSHGRAVPLQPWLSAFRSSFDVDERDHPDAARERVAGRAVLWDQALNEHLPIVFEFMGIADRKLPPVELDLEARRRKLLEFVCKASEARNRQQGGVFLWEDLHWLDPASDEMLSGWIEAIAGTRTLILTNFRPEYTGRWMDSDNHRAVHLRPLETGDIRTLLEDLLGNDPTVYSLPRMIEERTRGNPFFIEEVVQSLIESGHLRGRRGAYSLRTALRALEIPGSVQALLAARIDRLLETEKQILQAASVLGKIFDEHVLEKTLGMPRDRLAAPLASLQAAGLIFEEALYPVRRLAFKHPLTQEVAYRSQLADNRARTHRAAAEAIEELHADQLDEKAGLIAHHWETARAPLQAARWHERAAAWVGTKDILESLRHGRRVVELLAGLPDDEEHMRLGITTRIRMLQLAWRGGIVPDEAKRIFEEGASLAERISDVRLQAMLEILYSVCCGIWNEEESRRRHSNEAYDRALASGDPDLALVALVSLATSLVLLSRADEALDLLDRHATEIPEDVGASSFWGFSVRSYLLATRAACLSALGRLPEARTVVEHALELARHDGRIEGEISATGMAAVVCMDEGDPQAALQHAWRMLELAERYGSPTWVTLADVWAAYAHLLAGEPDEALERAQHCEDTMMAYGIEVGRCDLGAILAEARLARDEPALARQIATESIALARERSRDRALVRSLLVLARAEARLDARSTAACDTILAEARSLLERPSLRVELPRLAEACAEIARVRADQAGARRELEEAHRLCTEMGAHGHVTRLARLLR